MAYVRPVSGRSLPVRPIGSSGCIAREPAGAAKAAIPGVEHIHLQAHPYVAVAVRRRRSGLRDAGRSRSACVANEGLRHRRGSGPPSGRRSFVVFGDACRRDLLGVLRSPGADGVNVAARRRRRRRNRGARAARTRSSTATVAPPDSSADRLGRDGCSGAETPDAPSSRDTKSCHHGADSRGCPRSRGTVTARRRLARPAAGETGCARRTDELVDGDRRPPPDPSATASAAT